MKDYFSHHIHLYLSSNRRRPASIGRGYSVPFGKYSDFHYFRFDKGKHHPEIRHIKQGYISIERSHHPLEEWQDEEI
jgi:hypothetical protein